MTSYVLIVEDETLVRRALLQWLASLDYFARGVATAQEALECIERRVPDVVVTDLFLPTDDGIWLLERIRIHWPSLPVILSSGGLLSAEVMTSAYRLGAVDILEKPFKRDVFHRVCDAPLTERLQALLRPSIIVTPDVDCLLELR